MAQDASMRPAMTVVMTEPASTPFAGPFFVPVESQVPTIVVGVFVKRSGPLLR